MKYTNYQLSHKQVNKILDQWDKDKLFFSENHHGAVYWNSSTGEIIWYGNEECNGQLLEKPKK